MPLPTPPLIARLQEAMSFHSQGDLDAAALIYEQILKATPGHFDSLHLLGVIAMQRGQTAEAAELIGRAVQADRKQSAAHNNLGLALRALHRQEEALEAFTRALTLKVDNAEAHYNRALTLLDLQRLDQALAGFRKAISLKPDYVEAHINLGVTLTHLDRNEEAIAALETAATLTPQDANIHHNRGHALDGLRRYADAREAFARAIVLDPAHAESHVALSEMLFIAGDYQSSWKEYEWRWKTGGLAPLQRGFPQRMLTPEDDVAGQTILVHAEQGLGDTLMFCRTVPALAARGAKIILEVQPPLKRLMTTLAGVDQILARGEDLPSFDRHVPLLSLPYILGQHAGAAAPYLAADPQLTEKWQKILGEPRKRRVGLVWSGSAESRTGRRRNIPLSALKPLDDGSVELIGLQPDIHDSDADALKTFQHLQNRGPDLGDFADTAALVAALDLVITVDTAIAHLVGALGKPVWILLPFVPNWRWLSGDETKTHWYPTATLFPQRALHDWSGVVNNVAAALKTV